MISSSMFIKNIFLMVKNNNLHECRQPSPLMSVPWFSAEHERGVEGGII